MYARRNRSSVWGAVFGAIAPLACAIALAGCWPFGNHGPTVQQQYLDALNHGHSAEASQIWLNMSSEDREKWARSEGVSPQVSPAEVKKQVMQHYQDEVGSEQEGDTGVTQIAPAGGAGLQNLPSLTAPPNSASPVSSPGAGSN
ncbi:MAG TPA: hypothetical protein VNF27_02515 [Candidatus Binataceae bacterium]|nr:hypothetical protein [Candidatus Binataceae bacterium]